MRFRRVTLAAAAARFHEQRAFYERSLALPTRPQGDSFTTTVGETELEFVPGEDDPFYHFALLVPGDRFDAARLWIADRAELLPHADRPDVVFDFPAWDAQACYFHDPAGNIVELIAHRDIERNAGRGAFGPHELRGLSELGLVGRPTTMAPPLNDDLGLATWDGRVADEGGLAFVGAKARTLILVPTGRGWLPTGRPAKRHPVTAAIEGGAQREATLEHGLYRISSARAR